MKRVLPTSTAGSLPKPSWIAEPEKLWSPWKLEGADLAQPLSPGLPGRCVHLLPRGHESGPPPALQAGLRQHAQEVLR